MSRPVLLAGQIGDEDLHLILEMALAQSTIDPPRESEGKTSPD
jgi:hypothetical protein